MKHKHEKLLTEMIEENPGCWEYLAESTRNTLKEMGVTSFPLFVAKQRKEKRSSLHTHQITEDMSRWLTKKQHLVDKRTALLIHLIMTVDYGDEDGDDHAPDYHAPDFDVVHPYYGSGSVAYHGYNTDYNGPGNGC